MQNKPLFHLGSEGSAACLKQVLLERKVERIFLVTGKRSFEESGAADWLKPILKDISFTRFFDFAENPNTVDLKKSIALYDAADYDLIVAIGGGSVLDMAKLIGFFSGSKMDIDAYLNHPQKDSFEKQFLVAIPTTAGTGSEATHFAVLYRDKVKYSVADVSVFPDLTLVNPNLSSTMSPYLTACTGLDALAQGIEAYWAVASTGEAKKYAEKSIRLSLQYLEKAVHHPDAESRSGMAVAAYWAGRAINISKTTLCHGLSYPMTSYHGYPHGHAVALFLPKIIEYHQKLEVLPPAFLDLFKDSDPGNQINKLIQSIGLRLRENLSLSDAAKVAARVDLERMGNNPVSFNESELLEIISSVLIR